MIKIDESALICDLAETYNIFDYKSLPLIKVATFCVGLRDDSRIKLKISETKMPLEKLLLGMIVDRLGLLVWSKTEDARKGYNRPKSILQAMMGDIEKENLSFASGEEFEKAKREILGEGD